MEMTETLKELFKTTAGQLKGSERRVFMAKVARELGSGGQQQAVIELGWTHETIRKGRHELDSGIACVDGFNARGRKRIESKLPNLLQDIREIADPDSQTDGSFKSTRLYTRLSARAMRAALISHKHYTDETLPSEEVIRQRMNALGYHVRGVKKSTPQKR
jgi:Rhodopirellula transposase DDE domain